MKRYFTRDGKEITAGALLVSEPGIENNTTIDDFFLLKKVYRKGETLCFKDVQLLDDDNFTIYDRELSDGFQKLDKMKDTVRLACRILPVPPDKDNTQIMMDHLRSAFDKADQFLQEKRIELSESLDEAALRLRKSAPQINEETDYAIAAIEEYHLYRHKVAALYRMFLMLEHFKSDNTNRREND